MDFSAHIGAELLPWIVSGHSLKTSAWWFGRRCSAGFFAGRAVANLHARL